MGAMTDLERIDLEGKLQDQFPVLMRYIAAEFAARDEEISQLQQEQRDLKREIWNLQEKLQEAQRELSDDISRLRNQ